MGQTALSNNTFNRHSCLCFSARETELLAELPQTKSTQAVTTAQLMCSDLSHGPLTVHLVSQCKLSWRTVYSVSRAAKPFPMEHVPLQHTPLRARERVSKEWARCECEHLFLCLCCGLLFDFSYLKNAVLVIVVVNATLKIALCNLNLTLSEVSGCVCVRECACACIFHKCLYLRSLLFSFKIAHISHNCWSCSPTTHPD